MMRWLTVTGSLLVVMVMVPFSVHGKEDGTDKASLAAARAMMAVTGAEKSYESIMAVMGAQITRIVVAQNPGKEKAAVDILQPILKEAAPRKEEVLAQAAVIYAKQFTVDEMKAITAFYKSPVGLKLVAKLPVIMQQSIHAGQVWSQKVGSDIIERFKKEAKKQGLIK